jgi:hypothetical protein
MSEITEGASRRPAPGTPRWYRVAYVLCIVVLSGETMHSARTLTDHRFWLAGLEILAALLLLARRTQKVGLVGLLIVYAIVAIHAITLGGVPAALVLFAASAILIVSLDAARG